MIRLASITFGLLLAADGSTATAQPVGQIQPSRPPVFSPYLNLLRPGNSPGVNYYGLVRPQIQFQNSIQGLQQQVGTNQAAIAGLNAGMADNTIPTTGHTATFLNTGGYFSGPMGGGLAQGGIGGGVMGGVRMRAPFQQLQQGRAQQQLQPGGTSRAPPPRGR
ncbi:MAG: hypothetical protein JWO38_5488 [Gemmataceae bacterium]|nr:hypothetical protein [Gemmataceae bacterium]